MVQLTSGPKPNNECGSELNPGRGPFTMEVEPLCKQGFSDSNHSLLIYTPILFKLPWFQRCCLLLVMPDSEHALVLELIVNFNVGQSSRLFKVSLAVGTEDGYPSLGLPRISWVQAK